MNDLQTLLAEIGKRWGWEVGDKIKAEISALISAENVDIQQLQSAIKTIQGLLDADPGTEEFDVGQNIVTQLSEHLSRITALESAVEATGAAAVATAKQYADATFVKKEDVAAISAETLASMFRKAMDCGVNGASIEDVLGGTGDCAAANDSGDNGGSGDDSGDGAVV